jgi:ribosome-associated protein
VNTSKWPGLKYEILWEFARSRGPGGQNVNKTNSCAVARWSIDSSKVFTIEQKETLKRKLASKLTVENELLIRSEEQRDQ